MAGALTERDFVKKIDRAGFQGIEVHDRRPVSIDDLALYPLFTPELLELMRDHIEPAVQEHVGDVVLLSTHL